MPRSPPLVMFYLPLLPPKFHPFSVTLHYFVYFFPIKKHGHEGIKQWSGKLGDWD